MQSSDINSSKSVELLLPTSLFADIYFLHLSITKHLNRCIAARDMRMEYPSIRVSAEADLSCDGLIYAVLTPCTSSAPTSSTKNIFTEIRNKLLIFSIHYLSISFIDYYPRSARDRRACALRALGLLLADGTPTVGGGKTF